MGTPITWRNVEMAGNSGSDFGRPMQTALLGLNTGFDKLTGVYDQYEKQQIDRNTNLFQNKLAELTTPEQIQAARDSGAIAALRNQYGLQMDQNVARNGDRELLNKLYTDSSANNKYAIEKADFAINTPDVLAKNKFSLGKSAVDQAAASVIKTGAETNNLNASAGFTNSQTAGQLLKNSDYASPEAVAARQSGYKVTSTTNNEFLSPDNTLLRADNVNLSLRENENKKVDAINVASFDAAQTELQGELSKLRANAKAKNMSESDVIRATDDIVYALNKKHSLTTEFGNKLFTAASANLNGTAPTNVRLQEQAIQTEINKKIEAAAASQNMFYMDAQKPYKQKIDELHSVIDQEFNKNGWFDANPDNAKMALSKYIGETIDVKDGDKTLNIPVTVELLRDSMNLGAKDKRLFTGSATLDPDLIREKLREAAKKPSILEAYKMKRALDSGNINNIKEVRGYIPATK